MDRYGSVWRGVCAGLGAVGLVAALLLQPRDVVIVLGLLVMVGGLTAAAGYEVGDGERPRYTRGETVFIAVMACSALVAVAGLTALLGVAALWLLVLLGAVSPPAVRWYGRAGGAAPCPSGPDDALARTTDELCRQWRDSYDALQEATTPIARLRVVMERQRCLDELEHLDPEGLNAWLASTASAAGDPSRFLHHTDRT